MLPVDKGQLAANTGRLGDEGTDTITLSASVGMVSDTGNGTGISRLPTADGPAESQTVTITATDGKARRRSAS